MAVSPLRNEVLSLFKRILRTGRTWKSTNASKTEEERSYIVNEARYWFKKHKNLTGSVIKDHLQEGEARLEMALHYRNPYPRPVNLPPKSLTKKEGKKQGQIQEKLKEQSRPVYVKSIDDESGL